MDRQISYEVEKPAILYHASANRDIEEFEPRAEKYRDPHEGPVVFATPDKKYASCFLVKTDSSWVNIGRYSNNGVTSNWHMIVSDKDRFMKADGGGVIYGLPVDSFEFHPDRNMAELEWTSAIPVRPVKKEVFESGLQAMIENGVDVYFVDQVTFDAIQRSDDLGRVILESLTPEK